MKFSTGAIRKKAKITSTNRFLKIKLEIGEEVSDTGSGVTDAPSESSVTPRSAAITAAIFSVSKVTAPL